MTNTRTSMLMRGAACVILLTALLLATGGDALPRRPTRRPAHHHLHHRGGGHRGGHALPPALSSVARPPRHALPVAAPAAPAAPSTASVAALIEELRRKRNPQTSISVRQAEDIGMCKFVVSQDVDQNRIPEVIWTVTCREAGCQCGSEGDFRCTQLTSEVSVAYKNGAKNQVLFPNSGCICAAKEAADAMSSRPEVTE